MSDREEVINGLEWILNDIEENGHYQVGYYADEIREAIALLKEQGPVKPRYEDFFGNRIARCGYCNGYIVRYKYCPGCGRAVKRDADD